MKKYLNLDTWSRKNHFNFFKQFEEPFWGICVNVDCTKAKEIARSLNSSFFLYYLHKSIHAVNLIEEFRYRIEDDNKVVIHENIHASSTINREDGTFGFSYIEFKENFEDFTVSAQAEIERVRGNNDLTPAGGGDNVIHYSSIPWMSFTALSHARKYSINDSVPKISFGKLFEENSKLLMPVSVHVHHALMDGYHVAKHLEKFQELLDGK